MPSVPVYAFSFTAPSIIHQLGYTAAQAQLLTIPIYVLAMISVLAVSWLADRRKTRWPFIVGPYSVGLVGFLALMIIPHPRYPGLTYAFLFLIPAGCSPGVITLVTWVANNVAPTSKRAIGLAMAFTMGNLGGAVGSNIYLVEEAPRYWTGYGVSLTCTTVAIIAVFVLRWAYIKENKRRDSMSEEEIRAKYTEGTLPRVFIRNALLIAYRRTTRDGRQIAAVQICVLIHGIDMAATTTAMSHRVKGRCKNGYTRVD